MIAGFLFGVRCVTSLMRVRVARTRRGLYSPTSGGFRSTLSRLRFT